MRRHFTRLFKAVQKLGLINGCSVFYCYFYYRVIRHKKWAAVQMKLSCLPQPVWMRPGVSDWIVLERIFLDREYDPISQFHDRAMDKLERSIISVGKIPLIIDCGANIGLSSVWFAARFPGSTIISLEPQQSNFEMFARTAKNFPNIIPMQAAISDRMSNVALHDDGDTPWAWRTQESDKGDVAAVNVPHLLGLDGKYVLMAVKVDIEGFEVNLFRDGAGWLDSLPLIVFEMYDWMMPRVGSGHSFFSNLSRHPRDYLIRGENIFSYSHDIFPADA